MLGPRRSARQRERKLAQDIVKLNRAASDVDDNLEQSYRMVELLLEGGVPVDGNAPNYPSPLQLACFYGLFGIAELLIENGADLGLLTHDSPPRTVLCLAAAFTDSGRGDIDIVQLLLEGGADVSQVVAGGYTILHLVQSRTSIAQTTLALIAAGADIDARSDDNNTPLHMAVLRGDLELVELFLQNNASIDAVNDKGLTASSLAHSMISEHEENMDEDMDSDEEDEFEEHLSPWHDIIESIEVERQRREDLRLEELSQQKCLAVMMGHHKRLGEGSMISRLDPDVTRLVLGWV
jgi:ankyrin repeat protein